MKPKQSNLSKYMNFTRKNKSTNKGKFNPGMPNYIDSFTKYPNYLQSSLNDDIFLLKRKIKGYSKIHSHSNSNTNINMGSIGITKINTKMPITSYMNSMSPINNYIIKKKNYNDNCVNKSSKNHITQSSINNSSIIYSSKEKGISYPNKNVNNSNNISNYQSINYNNGNSNLYNNINRRSSLKNNNVISSYHNKNSIENEIYSQKNINPNNNINHFENNNSIKKKVKDDKYSITSINSRKNSTEKEKEEMEFIKKLNKLNFNGILNNYNNKRIIHSSKISQNNSNNNSNLINNMNHNINNNIKNSKMNSITSTKINKHLFIGDFFNLKKKKKSVNNFLESYIKAPHSSNNRKLMKEINMANNSNIHYKVLSNSNNANSISNNTISQNNNFPSSNYSPINKNKFYKTAKISPRSSFQRKNKDIIQSHRINLKNKLSGNIISFYNNYKNNSNNYNMNNGSMYKNSFNYDNNINFQNNRVNGPSNKKGKKNNMNVNMNITYNNKNYDMSNFRISSTNKNKHISNNNNFNKSSSVNKIKNNNFTSNYNNFNFKNNNYNINPNNSFITKNQNNSSTIIHNKMLSNENQIIGVGGNNIINNCEININYNNFNNFDYNNNNNFQNMVPNNSNINNNRIISEKIYNLFNKKEFMDMPNNNNFDDKNIKIPILNQEEIKKGGKASYTPINDNNINNNDIRMKNKNSYLKVSKTPLINNYDNSLINNNMNMNMNVNLYVNKKISNKNTSNNNSSININNDISKENLNIDKLLNDKEDDISGKNLYNYNKKINKKESKNKIEEYSYYNYKKDKNKTDIDIENEINDILELKHNLQKNKSENAIINPKNDYEVNTKIKEIQNTLSNLSSATHDSNYYMEKCNALSKYIKNYYKKYNKYPNTDLNFYLYGRLIGQGAFGKVNIGLNVLTGRVVAIKSFNKKTLNKNGDNMKKILYETNLMKKLNHPNITKILELFEDKILPIPKSHIFILLFKSISIFSNFISLWTIFCECICFIPKIICLNKNFAVFSDNFLLFLTKENKFPPFIYSMAIKI